jgi:hypothetical protein
MVSHMAGEEGELYRASRAPSIPGVVVEMIGSLPMDVPRRFYLTPDEAISVIEHFIAQGSADDGEWAALW